MSLENKLRETRSKAYSPTLALEVVSYLGAHPSVKDKSPSFIEDISRIALHVFMDVDILGRDFLERLGSYCRQGLEVTLETNLPSCAEERLEGFLHSHLGWVEYFMSKLESQEHHVRESYSHHVQSAGVLRRQYGKSAAIEHYFAAEAASVLVEILDSTKRKRFARYAIRHYNAFIEYFEDHCREIDPKTSNRLRHAKESTIRFSLSMG